MLVIIIDLVMTVSLAYSAPTETSTVPSNSTNSSASSDKPILRYQDDTPGSCCTDPSKKCCPYDFDDKKCENTDSRTLCGYNKNQKKPDMKPVFVTKQGLDCRVIEERVECGYDKGQVPDSGPQTKLNKQQQSKSDCCQCCNQN